MKRITTTLLMAVLSIIGSFAQVRPEHREEVYNPNQFKATQLIAPGVLLSAGIGIRLLAHDTWDLNIRNWNLELHKDLYISPVDDYVQYLPLAMDLGLEACGARARHGFADRAIEAAIGYAACGIICNVVKWSFPTMRPNENDTRSFPSGHTCFVFTGAELVNMEYSAGWAAAAYTTAGFVGTSRIVRDWHWFSDVLAGAAVGILSARIGGWLLEPAKNLLHIRTNPPLNQRQNDTGSISVLPSVDPISGTLCASASFSF